MSDSPVEDLRKEIQAGRVLVIVGSGVSTGATKGNPLASWTGLLKNGVDRCVSVRGLDSKWADRVRAEIGSGDMDDLLSAAEKISSKLGVPDGGEYQRWLRETVGSLFAEDRTVLEALRDLGTAKICASHSERPSRVERFRDFGKGCPYYRPYSRNLSNSGGSPAEP